MLWFYLFLSANGASSNGLVPSSIGQHHPSLADINEVSSPLTREAQKFDLRGSRS